MGGTAVAMTITANITIANAANLPIVLHSFSRLKVKKETVSHRFSERLKFRLLLVSIAALSGEESNLLFSSPQPIDI